MFNISTKFDYGKKRKKKKKLEKPKWEKIQFSEIKETLRKRGKKVIQETLPKRIQTRFFFSRYTHTTTRWKEERIGRLL